MSERLPLSTPPATRRVERTRRLVLVLPQPVTGVDPSPGDSPATSEDKFSAAVTEAAVQAAELAVSTRDKTAPISSADATKWPLIDAWGDSLTVGTGSSGASTTYPAVLSTKTGYTVTNYGVGGEHSDQIRARMVAATARHANPTIIWAGRNNYENPDRVVADIAIMVATLAAAGNTDRYLVLGVLNGSHGTYEAPGGEGYNYITGINARLAATYGDRYVAVREHLVSLYNPASSTDVADFAADRPPTSLRSDSTHLNDAGYAAVASLIETKIQTLRGEWPDFVSAKLLKQSLANAPAIGTEVAATDLISAFVRVGSVATNKFLSLSGDGSSIQTNGSLIPLTHNSVDVGYNAALAFRNAYFAGVIYSGDLVSTFVRIGSAATNRFFSLSGDGSSIQTNGSLIPLTHNSVDVGYNAALAFRNAFFAGTVTSETVSSRRNHVLSSYKDNSGAGYASGATVPLFTVGTYAKMTSGTLVVRAHSASSRWVACFSVAAIGGGDAVASISPLSSEVYGASSLAGTLAIAKDTPSGGTNRVEFTVGANAITGLEYYWSPVFTDTDAAIALA